MTNGRIERTNMATSLLNRQAGLQKRAAARASMNNWLQSRRASRSLRKTAGAAEWLDAAKEWLSDPKNQAILASIGTGGLAAGATYGLSGLTDPKGKNRLMRALAALGIGTGVGFGTRGLWEKAIPRIRMGLVDWQRNRLDKEYQASEPKTVDYRGMSYIKGASPFADKVHAHVAKGEKIAKLIEDYTKEDEALSYWPEHPDRVAELKATGGESPHGDYAQGGDLADI